LPLSLAANCLQLRSHPLQAALAAGLYPNLAYLKPSPKTEEFAKKAARDPNFAKSAGESAKVKNALNPRSVRWTSPQDGTVYPHPSSVLYQALPERR
jgi:hypothetical protein